jgi:hypothetical protein
VIWELAAAWVNKREAAQDDTRALTSDH